MEIRHSVHPSDAKHYDTARLREHFLVEKLFEAGQVHMVYTHEDRMVIGGAQPAETALTLEAPDTLKTGFFLERREIGFVNIGGDAVVTACGERYELSKLDTLFVGMGVRDLQLASKDAANPAKLYFCSALAHATYPTRKVSIQEANTLYLGSQATSNERELNQIIHEGGINSCQLMMGITVLKPGSVWNTMPSHLHDRRMEAYLYFDLAEDARVFHMMGEPSETRHLVVANEQAIISPSWSIHSGVGTSNYTFIWAMAGENYTFKDQDIVPPAELK
ncbi:5-dehydro-4-deoxy-D-glucuronate isomerase [Cohnella lubricantis]|uniref:4-deoxy-L-threo-5-hexosulose-uronate ketol-isomerase n=1 Tax=Cohnella lubricantis TaxID=2163172 RepID=A0A841THZ4_9BACL|nr:5-dehydro-4-deoxy-D-glucuronate isomerase [Cohnella lubricantis]MBB6679765.1 5-dehydro-4-deoxy-D-glucuronate isomerase [Cohnella lubricantis]MBP2118449.1 4-deoxy-L-threo-5-hexosulose-uronate ketol-isomerase [Cohnella lubricantis]